ncbi:hypothetical protein ACFYYH_18585 [Streptomyces sp. NPDC002018]|uniref:hypothetical protein n=1 Tax=Streptomyces sp. NPDC002018 TaxID=3364629 RepID=UPI0036B9C52F
MPRSLGRRVSLGAISLILAVPLGLGAALTASADEAPVRAKTVAELSATEAPVRAKTAAVADRPELNGYRIKSVTGATIYVVIDGKRRAIPSGPTYLNLFNSYVGVQHVIDIESITDGGPLSDGAILATSPSSDTIWLISNGLKRGITGRAFEKYAFDWHKVVTLSDIVLNSIPQGPNIDV